MSNRFLKLFGIASVCVCIVVVLDVLSVFDTLERRSVDLRAIVLPRAERPMTDEIVHIDIDDSAIEHVGRWPWDRAVLADAVDELHRAGARTVALDLLLDRPQVYPRGTEPTLDHDRQLADALRRVPSVAPVVLRDEAPFDASWFADDGAQLDRLLATLAVDIQLPIDVAADRAGLDAEARRRFAERPNAFRRIAAWRVVDGAETWEAFEAAAAPNRSGLSGDYPQRRLLRIVWSQHRAWRAIETKLGRGIHADSPRSRSGLDTPPLTMFAEALGSVGFVDADEALDADGRLRELPAAAAAPGGDVLQFGVAAAALHRGLAPTDVVASADTLRFGDRSIPLRRGRLWVTWPTSTSSPRWEGLLTREDSDAVSPTGHISVREVVELAKARRTRDELARHFRDTTSMILAFAQIDAHGDAALAAAADEVEFVLDDAPEDLSEEDRAFVDHLHNCRTWFETRAALDDADRRIALAEATLRAAVDDRLAFVGWTATGAAADFMPTALDSATPGVVVHAAVADMLLSGHSIRFLGALPAAIMTLLLGLVSAFASARLHAIPATLVSGSAAIGYAGVAAWLFMTFEFVFPIVAPIVAAAATWVVIMTLQAAWSQRDRQRITQQFRSRVSTQLVDFLVDNPGALTVHGAEREITVLFADFANFTSFSESMGGPRTVAMLNRYFRCVTDLLVEHGAYVNKFLGDGVMAFWSAFEDDPRQARRACDVIAASGPALEALNAESEAQGLPPLAMRIGVATGAVVVGDCGAPPALHDYTVIGDAVNLAARLESANKQLDTSNLIDGRTVELLETHDERLRAVGRITVVGQETPVDVYELMATAEEAAERAAPLEGHRRLVHK